MGSRSEEVAEGLAIYPGGKWWRRGCDELERYVIGERRCRQWAGRLAGVRGGALSWWLGWAVGAWGGVRFPVVLSCRVRGCEEVLQGGGGRAGGRQGWWVLGASRVGQPRGWCSGRRGERAGPKGGLAGDGCLAGRYGGRGWGL